MPTRCYLIPLLLAAAAMAGCAALPPDSGSTAVASMLGEHGLQLAPGAADEPAPGLPEEYRHKPINRGGALHIALLNNPELRAEFARLGFAAADVYTAGRLSNPVLSASLLVTDEGGAANQVGIGIVQSFTDLLLLPARKRFAEGQFERVQQLVAAAALRLAAEVDAAVIRLAAAQRNLQLQDAIATTARTTAELAQRFFDAGNISRLELAREQAAASEAEMGRIAAGATCVRARAELNRLMGLDAQDSGWAFAVELARPESAVATLEELLEQAARTRLDMAAARREVELSADAAGVTRRTRLLGALGLGLESERETDRSRISGPTLELELPVFDRGQGRVARSQARLALAQAELRALALDVDSEVRRAQAEVEETQARAEQYQRTLVPLREQIVRLTQERLNYMLAGQFETLLTRQQAYATYTAYLDAVRDYWLARVALARAIGTTLVAPVTVAIDVLALPDSALPPAELPANLDHSGHGAHPTPPPAPAPQAPHPDHPHHAGAGT